MPILLRDMGMAHTGYVMKCKRCAPCEYGHDQIGVK